MDLVVPFHTNNASGTEHTTYSLVTPFGTTVLAEEDRVYVESVMTGRSGERAMAAFSFCDQMASPPEAVVVSHICTYDYIPYDAPVERSFPSLTYSFQVHDAGSSGASRTFTAPGDDLGANGENPSFKKFILREGWTATGNGLKYCRIPKD